MKKKYKIPINIARTDDGWLLEAKPPGDHMMIHRSTKKELLDTLKNGLSNKIDELEAEISSE